MAHLWVQDDGRDWAIAQLDGGEAFVLTGDAAWPVRLRQQQQDPSCALIVRRQETGKETWILLSPKKAGVRVNGTALWTGMRVLRDRDEIQVEGPGRIYFSRQRPARIEPFPGADGTVFCPRCKLEITPGTPAVRCPNPQCYVWHHESEERDLLCWSYAEQCSLCRERTDLRPDYRYSWTPEDL